LAFPPIRVIPKHQEHQNRTKNNTMEMSRLAAFHHPLGNFWKNPRNVNFNTIWTDY